MEMVSFEILGDLLSRPASLSCPSYPEEIELRGVEEMEMISKLYLIENLFKIIAGLLFPAQGVIQKRSIKAIQRIVALDANCQLNLPTSCIGLHLLSCLHVKLFAYHEKPVRLHIFLSCIFDLLHF